MLVGRAVKKGNLYWPSAYDVTAISRCSNVDEMDHLHQVTKPGSRPGNTFLHILRVEAGGGGTCSPWKQEDFAWAGGPRAVNSHLCDSHMGSSQTTSPRHFMVNMVSVCEKPTPRDLLPRLLAQPALWQRRWQELTPFHPLGQKAPLKAACIADN